jgi:hypothetical protein
LASPSDAATDEVDLVDPLTVEPVDLEAAGGACIIAGVLSFVDGHDTSPTRTCV